MEEAKPPSMLERYNNWTDSNTDYINNIQNAQIDKIMKSDVGKAINRSSAYMSKTFGSTPPMNGPHLPQSDMATRYNNWTNLNSDYIKAKTNNMSDSASGMYKSAKSFFGFNKGGRTRRRRGGKKIKTMRRSNKRRNKSTRRR
jgi:hypothetical protein